METPYRAVNFSKHDPITRPDLNQVVANYQWINDNTPAGRFITQRDRMVDYYTIIIAGKAKIGKRPKMDSARVKVKFGARFDPDCKPAVTTGIVCQAQRSIHCTVGGLNKATYPNAIGFELRVKIDATSPKQDHIKSDFWVHWSAMGYRAEDMREF